MSDYTQRWAEGAEAMRQKLFRNSTASLWGKDPNPPRGPVKLLDLTVAWYALFSSHELETETGAGERRRLRTLDFFIAERAELTEEVGNEISSVMLDGKRYAVAADPRHEVGDPGYWRIICQATGETA